MFGGKKTAAPGCRPGVGVLILEHDVGGKVRVFSAQSVGCPGAEGGTAEATVPGVKKEFSRPVIDFVGPHAADHGEFIRHVCEMREEFRHDDAGFAARGKTIRRFNGSGLGGDEGEFLSAGQFLRQAFSVPFIQSRFGIEGVHLGGPSHHVEKDDPFYGSRIMGSRCWVLDARCSMLDARCWEVPAE